MSWIFCYLDITIALLSDTFLSMESERKISHRARKLEKTLASKLTEFLSSDIRYKLRRVLPAEMKNVYIGLDRMGMFLLQYM